MLGELGLDVVGVVRDWGARAGEVFFFLKKNPLFWHSRNYE